MIYVVGALLSLFIIVLGVALSMTAESAKAKERERQATIEADLIQRSEDVANKVGPDDDQLGNFWRGMRGPEK